MTPRVAGSIPGPFLNDYRAYGCGVTVTTYPQASNAPIPGLPPGLCSSCPPRRSSLAPTELAPVELAYPSSQNGRAPLNGPIYPTPFLRYGAPVFQGATTRGAVRTHPRG